MTARLSEIVIDCDDPAAAAAFWSEVLGWEVRHHNPGNIPWISASPDPESTDLKIVFVAAKSGATRLYVNPITGDLDAEVARLEALGAQRGDARGMPWVPMTGPGGAQLTVLPDAL